MTRTSYHCDSCVNCLAACLVQLREIRTARSSLQLSHTLLTHLIIFFNVFLISLARGGLEALSWGLCKSLSDVGGRGEGPGCLAQPSSAWAGLPHTAPHMHPLPCFQPQNVCATSCRGLTKQGGTPEVPAVLFSHTEEHQGGPWGPLCSVGLLVSAVYLSCPIACISRETACLDVVTSHTPASYLSPVSLQQKLPLDSMHFERGPRFWCLPTPWEDQTRCRTGIYTSSVNLSTAGNVNRGPPCGIYWCHQIKSAALN